MLEHIYSVENKIKLVENKIKLIENQLSRTTLTHVPSLAVRKAEMPDSDCFKYDESVGKLCVEFSNI